MKILITGGSGLLGSAISVHLRDFFDVISAYSSNKVEIKGCKTINLDITNRNHTNAKIGKMNPELIIHTAALVGVTACEKNPELAYQINVNGTENIVHASKMADSRLIYISTDYIFDGKKGIYSECDIPNPINVYGKTKLDGEKFIDLDRNTIVRTSIYGWNIIKVRKSFSSWAIQELESHRKIDVFDDQYNSMMLVNDLAVALREIIDIQYRGIINISSKERFSKHDFAVNLANTFGFDSSLINPIKNKQVSGYEKRPLNVSLDISKAKKNLKTKLPDLKGGLLHLKELKDKNYFDNFRVI